MDTLDTLAREALFWVLWPPLMLVLLVVFAITFVSSLALGGVIQALRALDRLTAQHNSER